MDIAALEKIVSPDDVFEIRIIGAKCVYSGYFTLPVLALRADSICKHIAGIECSQVYFTPQKLKSGVRSRGFGCLRSGNASATHDWDVEQMRWLIIDVDPVRKAGQSATSAEKIEAYNVADVIREQSNLPYVFVDSGNGYHLYLRWLASPQQHREAIQIIARKYGNELVKVDTSVCNPSRIMRVPGTWARKGENSEHRPHRISKLLEITNAD